jgi:hypothetical protein
MSRRSIVCDVCGKAIASLADGVVQWRRDHRDVVTALTLVHRGPRCTSGATDVGHQHAGAFLDARGAAELRNLARYLDVSASRVLRRVQALAKLEAAPAPNTRRAA